MPPKPIVEKSAHKLPSADKLNNLRLPVLEVAEFQKILLNLLDEPLPEQTRVLTVALKNNLADLVLQLDQTKSSITQLLISYKKESVYRDRPIHPGKSRLIKTTKPKLR
jgi:hypothetical protein